VPINGCAIAGERVAFHTALRVFFIMTMFIQRLRDLPILSLLIISLLITPAATSGYAQGVAADDRSLRNEVIAGDCASDKFIENAPYRWGKFPPRPGQQPGSLPASFLATTVAAQLPLPEHQLNSHRIINPTPRIPDLILHHRTIVLLI